MSETETFEASIEQTRDAAADRLDGAARTLRDKVSDLPGGERVSAAAEMAASGFSTTADYVRDHDFKQMMSDVETLIRRNPGPSLVAAAVIGFLAGRAFSSND